MLGHGAMSLRKVTLLGSNLASVTDFKLHTVCAVISEAIKLLQLCGQVAEFKFESKFEPLPVIWESLRRLFQKVIEGLEGKINDQALGGALLLCLGGRAQTQGVSEISGHTSHASEPPSTCLGFLLVTF